MTPAFIKMNGLGNDFVIVTDPFHPSSGAVRALADRRLGVGCDSVIALEPSGEADIRMRVWNADGGEAGACGNATRCVAWLLARTRRGEGVDIEVGGRILHAQVDGDQVSVDMGAPGLGWRDIPLAWDMDTREIQLRVTPQLSSPGCVSMGNPHAIFFVDHAETAPVERVGPIVEHHWLFPARTNVGFCQPLAPDRLRLRVWERGAGLTRACGTGACAALVVAHRRGLCGREATLLLDGGALDIHWREEDDHVIMSGPVAVEFTGRLPELADAA